MKYSIGLIKKFHKLNCFLCLTHTILIFCYCYVVVNYSTSSTQLSSNDKMSHKKPRCQKSLCKSLRLFNEHWILNLALDVQYSNKSLKLNITSITFIPYKCQASRNQSVNEYLNDSNPIVQFWVVGKELFFQRCPRMLWWWALNQSALYRANYALEKFCWGLAYLLLNLNNFIRLVTTKVVQLLHQTVDMKKSDKNQIVE